MRFLFLVLCTAAQGVAAETIVVETHPIEGDPFKEFRIEDCSAKRGLALMQYDSLAGPFVISDFCIDEDNALFTGAEIKHGFEQVSDTRAGLKFDIPGTRNRQFPPTSFTIFREGLGRSCDVEGIKAFDYPIFAQELDRYPEFDFAYAMGFTFDEFAAPPISVEPVEIEIGFTNFNQYDIENKSLGRTGLPTGISVYASLAISGAEGTLDVLEGDGYAVGDASGAFTVRIDDDGTVRLSGSFEAISLDENGHDIGKWSAIRGHVKYFRGYVFGEPARQVRGYGLVEGRFETVSGEEHPFRSDMTIIGCLQ